MKMGKLKRFLSAALVASLMLGTVCNTYADSSDVDSVVVDGVEWEELDEVIGDAEVTDSSSVIKEADSETNEEQQYEAGDQVRVFIVFKGDSVVDAGYEAEEIADNKKAIAYAEKLEDKQETIVEKIEDKIDDEIETRYNFTLLTNAVSATVAYEDIEAIEAVKGVEDVYIVPQYEAMKDSDEIKTVTAGEMVGSYSTWTNGYSGAGMRVAVMDTGLDTDHPSFDAEAYMYGLEETAKKDGKTIADYNLLEKAEIETALPLLNASKMYEGLTAEDVNLSDKVAFAFNYVDEDLDVTHDNDSQGDHGTHVSGITTANLYVPSAAGFVKQESGVVGVAPDAQLFVMKVFGKNGGAYTDDYMAAIEDAIVLGADVVNLSLGSNNAGESAASTEYIDSVMSKLTETNTVASISAGNAGYWSENSQYGANLTSDVSVDTVGSPGSYTNSFTVASVINSGYTAYAIEFDGQTKATYDDGGSGENKPFRSLDTNGSGTEYDYVLIEGYGSPEDYENIDVAGKIAVVSRGQITFAEKHMNAEAAGAIGVIVYNNTSGTISMSLSGSDATIPAASITLSDALAVVDNATMISEGVYEGKLVVSSKISTATNVADGYLMSDFSSWGVPGSLELKPEIAAPGGNIYSTLTDGQYGLMSGTSMAAPSVTGLTALTIQYIEENKLDEKTGLTKRALAQSLLMSSSIVLDEKTGIAYSPRKQGAGLANAYNATTAASYLLVGDKKGNDGKVKVELGDDPEKTGKYAFSFDAYSLDGQTAYYALDSDVLTETAEEAYGLSFIVNSSKKLNPDVKLSSDNTVLVYDVNADGEVNKDDAQALLAYVSGKLESDLVDGNEDEYDFNNDGIINTADVRNFLLAVSGKNDSVDLSAEKIVVADKTTIDVEINLSEEDREYLDETFENGMYVEGYIYLKGGVTLSVPFLAFYGNWTDSSMFDPYDYLEDANGGNAYPTYNGVASTNYLTYKFANDSKSYIYSSNMFVEDEYYMPERNALSSESGDAIGAFYYTLIRNASSVVTRVTDADTNEVYFESKKGSTIGTFYSSSQGAWLSTASTSTLNWAGTNAKGEALAEGTRVEISVTALPEYYNDGTKTPGKGATYSIPFVIDNTAPSAMLKEFNEEDKTMTVNVHDNNYVAALCVFESDKKTIIDKYVVNQTEADTYVELSFEYPETVFYVTVLDYAGNAKSYRVNKSGQEDTTITTGVTLSDSMVSIMKDNTYQLSAMVAPINITEEFTSVTWESSDETVATVDANGVVKALNDGTATITATTKAVNADGEHEKASCEVSVFSLDETLNAVVWDESGKVYFSEFNTTKLPEYTKKSSAMSKDFWAVADAGDVLIASAYSEDDSASDYYVVDPKTYESEYLFTSYWNTDMAYSDYSNYIFGTYGEYLIISDLSGNMVGAMSTTKYTGGNDVVGITYIGTGNSSYGVVEWFYVVDNAGDLYQWGYIQGLGSFFYKIGSTGISTNGLSYYDSLYYDEESDMIFYSVYDKSDIVKLYAIKHAYDEETEEDIVTPYQVGSFPESVWPVSGLYKANSASEENVNENRDLSKNFVVKKNLDKITNRISAERRSK